MRTADDYAKYRLVHRDGMTLRQIARTFHVSRRKVREALVCPHSPRPTPAPNRRRCRCLGHSPPSSTRSSATTSTRRPRSDIPPADPECRAPDEEGVIAPVPGIMRLFWAFSSSNPPESPSQEESSLASMPDTLEARCRSDGPPAGPRSIDPLPGSRSFLTVSAVA